MYSKINYSWPVEKRIYGSIGWQNVPTVLYGMEEMNFFSLYEMSLKTK